MLFIALSLNFLLARANILAGPAARPLVGEELRQYLVGDCDGSWEWTEDRGRPRRYEVSGEADSYFGLDSWTCTPPGKVIMYARSQRFVSDVCSGCGVSLEGTLSVQGRSVRIAAQRYVVKSRDGTALRTKNTPLSRVGMVIATSPDRVTIHWNDGPTVRYRKSRLPL